MMKLINFKLYIIEKNGCKGILFLLEENMKNHEPNQTTIKAIEEAEQMINDPNTPSYSTIEELIAALDE